MQPLTTHFSDRTFTYTQLVREGMHAIYAQTHTMSGVQRFEVVRIRIQKAHTWPNGDTTPEHEAYPGATSWGRDGWTCTTLEQARTVLATLARRATEELDDATVSRDV